MINSIKGKVCVLKENLITILNNDIEYIVYISSICAAKITENEVYRMLIYVHINENEITFFGFLDKEERDVFNLLIKVNGIGPKQAIKFLSNADCGDIVIFINNEDEENLSKISGIGRKTAQKIIVSLKENKDIKQFKVSNSDKKQTKSNLGSDIINALVNMGFEKKKVISVLKQLPQGLKDEEILRSAIINLSK